MPSDLRIDTRTASTWFPPPGRSWVDRAACHGEDPDMFFEVADSECALDRTHEALRVCARCPVAAECLRWALSTGQAHGVWGGTTPRQRRLLRRAASRPGEATPVEGG